MSRRMDKTPSGLNRRELMGTAAAVGAAAAGGFSLGGPAMAASAPVASVHLDVPFVSAHGAAPYSPPVRSAAEAGLVEPHELV
jgi:nitrous oxide reductase